jgi:hypothetical protein
MKWENLPEVKPDAHPLIFSEAAQYFVRVKSVVNVIAFKG